MPHVGFTFLAVVGVSLGALLYYVFANQNADNEQQNHDYRNYEQHNRQHSYSSEQNNTRSSPRPPPEYSDKRSSENGSTHRRRGPNTDKSTCTICLEELNYDDESVRFFECDHRFHIDCTRRWIESDPSERKKCPNCRMDLSRRS